jgi:hypothetical protein
MSRTAGGPQPFKYSSWRGYRQGVFWSRHGAKLPVKRPTRIGKLATDAGWSASGPASAKTESENTTAIRTFNIRSLNGFSTIQPIEASFATTSISSYFYEILLTQRDHSMVWERVSHTRHPCSQLLRRLSLSVLANRVNPSATVIP